MRRSALGAVVASVVTVGAVIASAPPASYTTIDRNGEPFKEHFNRDVDKVRVVALVAPT